MFSNIVCRSQVDKNTLRCFLHVWILLLTSCASANKFGYCRDRYGVLDVSSYNRRSCTMCYHYLFPGGKDLKPLQPTMEYLISTNLSIIAQLMPIPADVTNQTIINLVCSYLDDDECDRWRSCCISAFECCERQLRLPRINYDGSYCKRTWDGYGCWDDSLPGATKSRTCPTYVGYSAISNREAVKQCTLNGTWFSKRRLEWTDYTRCLDKESFIQGVYVNLGASIASIILLVPAIIIFISFRDLRTQHRVCVHMNFFLSLTVTAVVNIAWYLLVHYDLLVNPLHKATVTYRNPAWCRLLSFFKIYLTSTNYFWMFCEGYYLHRLISNAFEPPKTLLALYLFGWAVPAVPALVYAVIRAALSNMNCWAKGFGGYEWFIYGPNLVCLSVNLLFLCNIMRILLFQLHAHPHEPSNFRKGLKAAFMLIPLFGLQMFLTIYRPPVGATGEREYEYITIIIANAQGVFVSLVYCFFNGEVITHLRRTCNCFRYIGRQPTTGGPMTQFTSFDLERRSPTGSLGSFHNGSPKTAGRNGHVSFNVCPTTDSLYEMREVNKAKYGYADANNGKFDGTCSLSSRGKPVGAPADDQVSDTVVILKPNCVSMSDVTTSTAQVASKEVMPSAGMQGYKSIPLIITTEA